MRLTSDEVRALRDQLPPGRVSVDLDEDVGLPSMRKPHMLVTLRDSITGEVARRFSLYRDGTVEHDRDGYADFLDVG